MNSASGPGLRSAPAGERAQRGNSTREPWDLRTQIALVVIMLVLAVLLLRRLYDASLHYPDADRIRMNGVFVLDFLKVLPIRRIYEFTTLYYAQYPAINLGYHMPFFPLIEALFNAVFGINVWSSRLALLPFAFVGTAAWFALVRRMFDTPTAFWATLAFATTPFVVQWGWYTMSDLPLLFLTMLIAYLFYRSTESSAPGYVYATALVFVFAGWTKQTAIFLVIWFALYLGLRRRLFSYLASLHVWVAMVITVIALAPVAVMTLRLGDFNLAQSVGAYDLPDLLDRFTWYNLLLYPRYLVEFQLTTPILALSAAGLALALRKRDPRLLYFGALIATTYGFFTYVLAKEPRYAMSWIPAFTLFAALPVSYLKRSPVWRRVYMLLLAGVVVYQVAHVYTIAPLYAKGYDEAARYVVDQRKSNRVFFDGGYNGSFTYFVRAFDRDRLVFILRGDKLLSSSALDKSRHLEVHVRSRAEIADILDKYGVTDIVVESPETSAVEIHHELRRFLDSGPFRLIKTIPVDSNLPDLQGRTLKFYRYLDAKSATADHLELHLPVVGATIDVPLRHATER